MQIKSFIVRVWRDQLGRLHGHVSDPVTQQRYPFTGTAQLLQLLCALHACDIDPPPVEGAKS